MDTISSDDYGLIRGCTCSLFAWFLLCDDIGQFGFDLHIFIYKTPFFALCSHKIWKKVAFFWMRTIHKLPFLREIISVVNKWNKYTLSCSNLSVPCSRINQRSTAHISMLICPLRCCCCCCSCCCCKRWLYASARACQCWRLPLTPSSKGVNFSVNDVKALRKKIFKFYWTGKLMFIDVPHKQVDIWNRWN